MYRHELPETCLSVIATTGQLIIIKKGERGYYPSEWDTGDKAQNREIADFHNGKRGITAFQESAMVAGSMFGWTVPGANPQWHLDHAKYVNCSMVKGHIKDPVLSLMYPIENFLLRYEVAGKQRFYLPLAALPEGLMGGNTQHIMLPDLVLGVPVMPVTATENQNGSYTIQLETGSFGVGKSINAGYHFFAKVRVGNAEFAIGEHPKAPDRYATWERNCKNDGDGPPNYFWGHYGNDRTAMVEDFCDRAKNEYEMLMERQRPAAERRNDNKER